MREIDAPLILQPRVRWGGTWGPTSQRAAHYRPRRAQGRGEDMGVIRACSGKAELRSVDRNGSGRMRRIISAGRRDQGFRHPQAPWQADPSPRTQ